MRTRSATLTSTPPTPAKVPLRALLRVSLVATVAAAAATETLTAIVRIAGVDLAVGNPGGSPSSVVPVNAGACAIAVAMCMVTGTAMAAIINWRSSRPARTYRIAAAVLALLSPVAPLTAAGTDNATKLTLICAHLLAAAVVITMVSRCLAGTR
ncbi:DUF6069 family protein [Kribbella pratensis]|uniref:DUF998 domain-containing protein n=1 Tax=Kribbella pratensis TaxID=2512112 RepID=A0A4R8CP67_9ACTN|nr:DUF6069 family protein [Kribbella pratensis]TDW77938.1 hypothetical protein EV653_3121 [Kribbella pratensis]